MTILNKLLLPIYYAALAAHMVINAIILFLSNQVMPRLG